MEKPKIGIIANSYNTKSNETIYGVSSSLAKCIEKLDGNVIGIIPQQNNNEFSLLNDTQNKDIISVVNSCDAILMYGKLRISNFDVCLYKYVVEYNVPFLGINSGMQLMSYYETDSKSVLKSAPSDHLVPWQDAHHLEIYDGTLLKKIIEKNSIITNSRHSYCVSNPNMYIVSAKSFDGVIEAIENPNSKYMQLGVQWDLDQMLATNKDGIKIIEYFISDAKRYQEEKVKQLNILAKEYIKKIKW